MGSEMCIRDSHHSNRQIVNNLLFRKFHTTRLPIFAAHLRTAVGNERTTCFSQIAHYTPAFVAAHRRRSLFTPAVRSSSKSQNWITHRPAALCSCHSLNPLHASVLKQGPSSSPDFSAEISPAEPVATNIDVVTGRRMNCRVTTTVVEGLLSSTGHN